MTFPTFDLQAGLQLNAEGTDIVPIWPKDRLAWTSAVIKARLWLIKGSWKYDINEGVDLLGQVLGQPYKERVIQEIFRAEIARDVRLTSLRLRNTDEGVFLDWKGGAAAEISGTISLIEPPPQKLVTFQNYKLTNGGAGASFSFSEPLYEQIVPTNDSFELSREATPPTISSITLRGTHMFMAFSADVTGSELLYTSGVKPMRGETQELVKPFRVVLD